MKDKIKASELRIGNYVMFQENGIYEVDSIDRPENTIQALYEPNKSRIVDRIHNFQPIPLTEQWLIDFGFEKGEKANRNENVFTIDVKTSGNRYYFVKYGKQYDWEFGDMTFAQLDYVHQLQNLYFALTGKELTKQ